MTVEDKNIKTEEIVKFKGKFISATGRRKTATARVRMYKNGSGVIIINDKNINDYFTIDTRTFVYQPLKQTGHIKDMNFSITVSGGGKNAQAEACRHAICSIIIEIEPETRPALKAKGWLTRDARKKERKKPGLKKARRAPQWAKR
jgi:small subunit ribosomal protein S9